MHINTHNKYELKAKSRTESRFKWISLPHTRTHALHANTCWRCRRQGCNSPKIYYLVRDLPFVRLFANNGIRCVRHTFADDAIFAHRFSEPQSTAETAQRIPSICRRSITGTLNSFFLRSFARWNRESKNKRRTPLRCLFGCFATGVQTISAIKQKLNVLCTHTQTHTPHQ